MMTTVARWNTGENDIQLELGVITRLRWMYIFLQINIEYNHTVEVTIFKEAYITGSKIANREQCI